MLRIIFIILFSFILLSCAHRSQDDQQSADQGEYSSLVSKQGEQIVQIAKSLLGSPYKYGGASPKGFDCSGLVFYTHKKLGIHTPRTSLQQYRHSKAIKRDQLTPGDLVFFKLNKSSVSHVGIFIGNDQFIHAPKRGKQVSVNTLNDVFWKPRFVSAGRLY